MVMLCVLKAFSECRKHMIAELPQLHNECLFKKLIIETFSCDVLRVLFTTNLPGICCGLENRTEDRLNLSSARIELWRSDSHFIMQILQFSQRQGIPMWILIFKITSAIIENIKMLSCRTD